MEEWISVLRVKPWKEGDDRQPAKFITEVTDMPEPSDPTVAFNRELAANDPKQILGEVYRALREKGYNPIDQIVGYLISGDPAYITGYHDARLLIKQVGRDEILEMLLRGYFGV